MPLLYSILGLAVLRAYDQQLQTTMKIYMRCTQFSNQEKLSYLVSLYFGSVVLLTGFVAQINFELGFSLTPYLSKNTLSRWRTQMGETI